VSVPESVGALLERVLARVAELETALAERDRVIAEQGERIAELERRLGQDSSNSSRPPSSDAPWVKKAAKKRSSRGRSGRKPGKQPGASSSSRSLVDDPDETVVVEPKCCRVCESSLADAEEAGRERRQVVDVGPVPPPEVTEYQRVSKVCACCGVVTTPGWDEINQDDSRRHVVTSPGSPVRIGPETLARAALLTCGHFLPVGRA
jgi:transposase